MITGLQLEEGLQLDKASSACHENKTISFSMKLSEATILHREGTRHPKMPDLEGNLLGGC